MILIHGGNDMLRKVAPQQIMDNLQEMIRIIRQHNAQPVMMASPKPGLLLKPAPFYETVAVAENAPLEQQTLARILQSRNSKSDTIHPNDTGYRQMAEALTELLRRSGSLP